jgi:predicted phage terminase large subunit-like protein
VPTEAELDSTRSEEYQLLRVLEEEEKRLLQKNFAVFLREAWKILNPYTPLHEGQYIDAVAETLQAVRDGRITRQIINIPPRSGKSTFVSIAFPCWVWTTDPSKKFIFYSYSFDKLSVPFSLERRRLIQSEWYQSRWGNVFELSFDENMKWMFSNSATGRMTVLTGATGIGGNFLLIDDPHSTEQAESEAEREGGVKKVREGLMSRLDQPQSDPVIIIMQRLHDSDVTGQFLRDGGWNHLYLPAKAEKKMMVSLPTKKRKWIRPAGDLLDPVRFSEEVLQQKKIELGTRAFYAQYQQEPAPPTGTIFNTGWWQWYTNPPMFEQVVVSVDAAFKDTKTSNDVAIHAWGMVGIKSYLIKRDTRKMGFAATKAAIRAMVWETGATVVLIEEKANGAAIIEELKTEFVTIPIDPGFGDKVARAEACSPTVEAGIVYLPSNADGVKIQTLAAKFPNADKDDIDALTQFLNWRRKHGAMMQWFEEQAKKAQAKSEGEPNDKAKRIEHPTPKEVHRLAMEQAGMKTARPKMTKPVKAEELKKAEPDKNACPDCGGKALFRSAKGVKCLNPQCGKVFPAAERVVNVG